MDKYLGTAGNSLDLDELRNVFRPIGYYGANVGDYRKAEKMLVDTLYTEMLHKGMLGIPLESTAWEGKTYTWADRFVCDDWDLVQVYLRDGKYTDGLNDEYQLLGKIVNGDAIGRANEDEFVIASSHGIALSDIAVAQMLYDKATEKNVGTVLPLMQEADIIF
jgi:hypothetical protein